MILSRRHVALLLMAAVLLAGCAPAHSSGPTSGTAIPSSPPETATPGIPQFTLIPSPSPDESNVSPTSAAMSGFTPIPSSSPREAKPVSETSLRIIDISSGTTRTVDISPLRHWNDIGMLAWSPDGQSIALSACDQDSYVQTNDVHNCRPDLYILEVNTGKLRRLGQTRSPNERFNEHVDWSPDGQWLAFGMNGNGSHIYLVHPDGSGFHSILAYDQGSAEVTSWTRDSQYLLYYVFKGGESPRCYSDIYISDSAGKHPLRLFTDVLSCGPLPVAVSPDGKTIYYWNDNGIFMSPVGCYYQGNCSDLPSQEVVSWPATWYKDYTPRWTGEYPTYP